MKLSNIITLTTDFGESDYYVGTMKAVILNISPRVKLVDISHHVPPGDINHTAFILKSAVPFFPEGSIHIAVVDPGVGTKRRPILVQAKNHLLVGPDNGIFSDFIDPNSRIYHLDKKKYFLENISQTFHARDIFAPVAAHLLAGKNPSQLGKRISDPVMLDRPQPVLEKGMIKGQVIHIDRFGNLVTNIPGNIIPKNPVVKIAGYRITGLASSYMGHKKAKPIAIIGSANLLEVSIPQGSAAKRLKARTGQKVIITKI
jgi:S-adenosylmethionine hydrolase